MLFFSPFDPFGLAPVASFFVKTFLGVESPQGVVLSYEDVQTDKCGPHVHINQSQERSAFEALGMAYDGALWEQFVKKPLAIDGEVAMRLSFYARRTNGELYRFGWVRSVKPRSFSQAEVAPEAYRQLTGKAHARERMSGELEGAETVEIVAVQLDFGEMIFLKASFALHLIVPKLHAHVPIGYSVQEITVCYGNLAVTMPAKPGPCQAILVHPHSEDDARLKAAIAEAEQEEQRILDGSFAAAVPGLF